MSALPVEFITDMREMLGDETPAFLRAMEDAPTLALRLNPRRANAEAAAAAFVDGTVPWEPLGRYLKPGAKPGAAIAHWAGAYYVQEASAMLSAAVLKARPGEVILDLCAAPGGKSTQIAAAMDGCGLLVSNDPEPSRAKALAGNLERMGAANAVVVNAYPDRLASRWHEVFDAILVDAPCSGEGMFRREPEARDEWQPGSPQGCASRQADILDAAAHMLKPGGRLVYSTCTFNRFENEGSIAHFLERHPEFAPEEFEIDGVGASRGGMIRIFPHRVRGDGHFAAKLRKSGDSVPMTRSGRPLKSDPEVQKCIAMLERDVCALPDTMRDMLPTLRGEYLTIAPGIAPPLDGIRVVSPGLSILRAGRNYVEPAHALAMALPVECAHLTAELDDTQAVKYLAGEVIEGMPGKGWALVLWKGMPLGWGKVAGGVLKNHLPKGLRKRIYLEET